MRVHRRMERGLYEKHYQNALTAELLKDGLTCPEEFHLEVYDGDVWLGRLYVDHWVNECVAVESKAVSHRMGDREIAQVVTYLAALEAKVGLLLNFGRASLEFRRVLPARDRTNWQKHAAPFLWRPDHGQAPGLKSAGNE